MHRALLPSFAIACTETLVTSVGISPFCSALQPADAALFIDIKLRHIGFDIQYWRSIKQVHAQHNQTFFGHRLETQYRQTDGIGPFGGAGGKETTLLGIEKGGHYKVVAAVGMQMTEYIDMGEATQVAQALAKWRIDFNASFHLGRAPGLNGHAF